MVKELVEFYLFLIRIYVFWGCGPAVIFDTKIHDQRLLLYGLLSFGMHLLNLQFQILNQEDFLVGESRLETSDILFI